MALLSLGRDGVAAPAPGARFIKRDEYAALVEANEIVGEARRRAEAVIAEAEALRESRRREGFEAGLAEGREQSARQMVEMATRAVDGLSRMESSIVDMVVRSIRTVLGRFDREELVAEVVGHALRLVCDQKRILLRVSPDDAEALKARLGELTARYPGMVRVDMAADPALSAGDCVMETELGVVDAGLERQLGMIEAALRQHVETAEA